MKLELFLRNVDWRVTVYYNPKNYNDVVKSLTMERCSYDRLNSILLFIEENEEDSGCIYTNKKFKSSIIIVGRSSSLGEFINTLDHEKNHLEMHICSTLGIDPFSEEAAVLSGEISQKLLDDALSVLLK